MPRNIAANIHIKEKLDEFHFFRELKQAFIKPFSKEFLKLAAIPFLITVIWSYFDPKVDKLPELWLIMIIPNYFIGSLIFIPFYTAYINHEYYGEKLKLSIGKREIVYLLLDIFLCILSFVFVTFVVVYICNNIYKFPPNALSEHIPTAALFFRPFFKIFFALIALRFVGSGRMKKAFLIALKAYWQLLGFFLLILCVFRAIPHFFEFILKFVNVPTIIQNVGSFYAFYIMAVSAVFLSSLLKASIDVREDEKQAPAAS